MDMYYGFKSIEKQHAILTMDLPFLYTLEFIGVFHCLVYYNPKEGVQPISMHDVFFQYLVTLV